MKLIEQGLNALSSSEIRVAILPVGPIPPKVLLEYEQLVEGYSHVRLSTVRSFHHEKQKSPFKHLPWNKGFLNLRFLKGNSTQPSALSCLYASRAVLGVIGICHCPSYPDIPRAYTEFERATKQFPNCVVLRCFAFEPLTDEMSQNGRQKEHLITFPKCGPLLYDNQERDLSNLGDRDQLEHTLEVMMHDFAACLLMELQQGMLNLSVGMMTLSSVLDNPDVFGYSGTTDEITKRMGTEEEVRMRRRHTRMQKLFGDWSMLAGSPRDAYDHYSTCVELSRYCGDAIWGAAAVEGMAEAKILEALIDNELVPIQDRLSGTDRLAQNGSREEAKTPKKSSKNEFGDCCTGYLEERLWRSIGQIPDLQNQVLAFFYESEGVYSRRGILPLQIEVQLKTIRALLSLQGHASKSRVYTIVTNLLEEWPKLKSEFDRMTVVTELSKILDALGLKRKRAFLIWQAFDSPHLMQSSDVTLIALTLKSEAEDDVWNLKESVNYSTKNLLTTPSWPVLHRGIAEAVLPTASKAGMDIVVWESAATLLRDYFSVIPQERQQMFMDVLRRAAGQMSPDDKTRLTVGPPPYFQVRNICHLADHLRPHLCDELSDKPPPGKSAENTFIFNPYAAKRESDAKHEKQEMSRWVVGEECTLEVYISNPCSVQLKIERMCLCIEDNGDKNQKAAPISVAVVLPPKTKPTRVSLGVIPHFSGPLRVIGCNVTLYGVPWVQRFVTSLRRVPRMPGIFLTDPEWGTDKNMAVELDVVPAMPLLKWQFLRSESDQVWPDISKDQSTQEKQKALRVVVRAGQRLDFKLRITNTSQHTVLRARLLSDHESTLPDTRPLRVESKEGEVMTKLPIFPNDVTEMPVRVLVSHRTAGQSSRDIHAKIRLIYAGPHLDSTDLFGRELAAPLSFKILPSTNIVSIQITQHFVPMVSTRAPSRRASGRLLPLEDAEEVSIEGSKSSLQPEADISGFSSQCLLRATIANLDTQVLCVWMGEVPSDSFSGQKWQPPSAPASHSVVPGQAVQVSCLVPSMPSNQIAPEKDLETATAEWISSTLCGYWQSVAHQPTFTEQDETRSMGPAFDLNPSFGSQGTVPINEVQLARAMNPTVLSTIVKDYITLSVQLAPPFTMDYVDLKKIMAVEPDSETFIDPPLIDEPVEEWTIQASSLENRSQGGPSLHTSNSSRPDLPKGPNGPNGEIWGVQTEVGEFINCEVVIENASRHNLENICISICSERIDQTGDSVEILFRREGSLNDAGILLVGRVSNVQISTEASSIFTHKSGRL